MRIQVQVSPSPKGGAFRQLVFHQISSSPLSGATVLSLAKSIVSCRTASRLLRSQVAPIRRHREQQRLLVGHY